MKFETGRLRGSLLKFGTAVALAAFAVGASAMPASAQVVNRGDYSRSDKAERKAEKKAARLNRGDAQRDNVVVNPTLNRGGVANNGPVVDRSQYPTQVKPSRNRTPNKNYTYRNGYYYDRNGNRVYDYRNSPVDPYAAYPQYRRNNGYNNYPYNGTYSNGGYYGNNGGYYGNSGGYYGNNGGYYGNGGYPNYGSYNNGKGDKDRDDVYRRGQQNGYRAGVERGQFDASQRNRPVPTGHGAYQYGYDGFDPSWGWASSYQQAYRQAFLQGYNDGYNRGGSRGRW